MSRVPRQVAAVTGGAQGNPALFATAALALATMAIDAAWASAAASGWEIGPRLTAIGALWHERGLTAGLACVAVSQILGRLGARATRELGALAIGLPLLALAPPAARAVLAVLLVGAAVAAATARAERGAAIASTALGAWLASAACVDGWPPGESVDARGCAEATLAMAPSIAGAAGAALLLALAALADRSRRDAAVLAGGAVWAAHAALVSAHDHLLASALARAPSHDLAAGSPLTTALIAADVLAVLAIGALALRAASPPPSRDRRHRIPLVALAITVIALGAIDVGAQRCLLVRETAAAIRRLATDAPLAALEGRPRAPVLVSGAQIVALPSGRAALFEGPAAVVVEPGDRAAVSSILGGAPCLHLPADARLRDVADLAARAELCRHARVCALDATAPGDAEPRSPIAALARARIRAIDVSIGAHDEILHRIDERRRIVPRVALEIASDPARPLASVPPSVEVLIAPPCRGEEPRPPPARERAHVSLALRDGALALTALAAFAALLGRAGARRG